MLYSNYFIKKNDKIYNLYRIMFSFFYYYELKIYLLTQDFEFKNLTKFYSYPFRKNIHTVIGRKNAKISW